MKSSRHADIERFVRETLGCQCPDEVFRSIEHAPGPLTGGVNVSARLVIGKKLLVYTVQEENLESLESDIRDLIIAGKSDREGHGLSRFRLVIASREPERIRGIAEYAFAALDDRDERMHLHVVNDSDLP